MKTWIGGAVLLACTTMANAATPQQLQDLDATVERVRTQFDVPGIAVAVVKDGQVVLERGWGVREQGKPEPVQADTLFAIASNTKAFTATSLNLLAEDGKLKMDDKVIDHLPSFRMSDPFVTGQMTIRDLLSHRSGLSLGAGDLLFWPATSYSNAEVVERLGRVPLKGGFRESYAYDNILYAVAQQVIERVSGMSYQQFLQTRIFDKVGMAGTRYNADHLKPGDKAAVGHAKYDFKDLRTVAPLTWSNNAGAGGIYSSAHDMARWMQVQLAEGKLADGTPLFSEKSQQQMWRMITPQSIPAPSVLTLVPGEKLGVVVLTNQEVGAAFNAITLSVLDAYMGGDKHDWVDAYAKAVAKGQDKADEAWAKHQSARDKGSRPSLALAGYTGSFRDRWYGDMQISAEGKGLHLRFAKTAQLSGRLEHWQHDTFIVRWDDRSLNADAFVNFSLDPDGKVREVRMQSISDLTDFSFDFQDLLFTPVRE